MAGNICHMEICTTDLDRSEAFLSGLFGWEFREFQPTYRMFSTSDGPGGGLEKVDSPAGTGGIQIYVQVESVVGSIAKAETLGGEVVKPRTEIGGGHGAFGQVRDPGGTVIGLWEPDA